MYVAFEIFNFHLFISFFVCILFFVSVCVCFRFFDFAYEQAKEYYYLLSTQLARFSYYSEYHFFG